jgi:hypothetical protein
MWYDASMMTPLILTYLAVGMLYSRWLVLTATQHLEVRVPLHVFVLHAVLWPPSLAWLVLSTLISLRRLRREMVRIRESAEESTNA